MSYREYPPSPALRALVACYWTQDAGSPERGPRLVLPDGCLDFLFRIAPDGAVRGLVIGTMRTAARVAGSSDAYVGVRFLPGGVHPFLRLDCAELTDDAAELPALWTPARGDLPARLSEIPSPAGRVAAVEELLLRHLPRPDAVDRRLHAAIALAWRDPRMLRVDDLAAAADWGARQLERRCLERVGIGPKRLLRILRFQAFVQRGSLGVDGALEAGYFDQAHLIREFRDLAGTTPGGYFRAMSDLSNPPPAPPR